MTTVSKRVLMERNPYFLIRRVSTKLRRKLEEEARENDEPIQQVIRRILCMHYELGCDPIAGMLRKDAWRGSRTIRLTMQPELHSAIKQDAAETGESMQSLVHQALESRYVTERTPA